MKTKSQLNALKIIFISITTLIVLPVTIWITTLLINKPKVTQEPPKPTQSILPKKESNERLIESIINFNYTAPDTTWKHRIISSKTNPTSSIKSLELEIYNDKSSMNLIINEVDQRLKSASAIDIKFLNQDYDSKFYNYLEADPKLFINISSNEISNYVRVPNTKSKSGQIILDVFSPNKPKNKPINYNSTLNPFIGYSQDYRLYTLNTQVTYSQDTDENYAILDQIFNSIKYTK